MDYEKNHQKAIGKKGIELFYTVFVLEPLDIFDVACKKTEWK